MKISQNTIQNTEKAIAKVKTPLHKAVINNEEGVVIKLVNDGVDINALDEENNSPIFYAVKNLNLKIVQFLIIKGAQTVFMVDKEIAKTPLVDVLIIQDKLLKNSERTNGEQNTILINISHSIFTLIKSAISSELSTPKNIGINALILPDGRIRFMKNLEESLDYQKSLNVSATNYHYDYTNNKTTVFDYNHKNELYRLQHQHERIQYDMPPLVFLMEHNDNATFELLYRHNFFQQFGYKTICVEFDNNLNLEQTLRLFKYNVQKPATDSTSAKIDAEENKDKELLITLLEKIKSQINLKYVGIDLSLGPLRKKQWDPITLSDSMTDIRNEKLAENIVKESDESRGGTITILGLKHHGFQKKLIQLAANNINQYIFIHCFSSDSKLYTRDSSYTSWQVNFPLGFIDLDVRKGFKEAEQTLFIAMVNKIPSMIFPKVKYDKALDNDVINGINTRKLMSLPFKAMQDQYSYIDAVLPLDTILNLRVVEKLSDLCDLLSKLRQNIKFHPHYRPRIVRFTTKDEAKKSISATSISEDKLALVIPRINAENAKVLKTADQEKPKTITKVFETNKTNKI